MTTPATAKTGAATVALASPSGAEAAFLAELRRECNPGPSAPANDVRGDGKPSQCALRYVKRVRSQLMERHFAGAGGAEIVGAFTAAIDSLVRALFAFAHEEAIKRIPRLGHHITIIARGGYGRAELNPHSDIDLIFLHDWKPGPYLELVHEIVTRALEGAGFRVGHATRTITECVKWANHRLDERTAIIDARFLAGDEELYAKFERKIADEVVSRNQEKFYEDKLAESRSRHQKFGESVYLLEPELKEGQGGLRDLHTALWIAKVKFGVHSLEELVQKAVITPVELEKISAARDFLFRVRNTLHFLEDRHFDRLTLENQERMAPLLGFGDRAGPEAGAALMRAYYDQAGTIEMFADTLIARAQAEPSRRILDRLRSRTIRPGVIIRKNVLIVTEPEVFTRDPFNLVAIFLDCQKSGAKLSGETYGMVRKHLGLIDENFSPERVGKALLEILSARERVADTLEAMHQAGVLGAVIPEFGRLSGRSLHDLYHIYTVDRHTLVAIRELERLRAGKFRAENPMLTEVAHEFDSMPLVFLALLLHDIGKGEGGEHHERGARSAAWVTDRLPLDKEQADLVVFLVRHHLLMSQLAQKGDIEDTATVADFAREAGSADRLKALYLMTFADIRAVAPSVYNNWRDLLLGELYMRALKLLQHGHQEVVDPQRRLDLVKGAVRAQLAAAGAPPQEVADFLEQMPDRYFLTVPDADIKPHFDLMRSLGNEAVVCRHRHVPDREFTEFWVVTRDQPGLFSRIAGALAANNLNILSARITTRADSTVLDVFRISHHGPAGAIALEDSRWRKVQLDLEAVIRGERNVEQLVQNARGTWSLGRKSVRTGRTEVTIDNKGEQLTAIDVFTQDRLGLLFTITHTLFKLGLVIHQANISTNHGQALDVFYVTDREDRRITDAGHIDGIRAALIAALDGAEQQPAQSASA